MNIKIKNNYPLVLLTLLVLTLSAKGQGYTGKVIVNSQHQIYKKGQTFTILSQLLYNGDTRNITCHYTSPSEFYKSTNSMGEIVVYLPQKNEVSYTQNSQFSSNNELLYYFINNKTQDLGLVEEGFIQSETKKEDQYLISEWIAPAGLKSLHKVKMVFENFVPIYAEYQGLNGKPLKKIYYYQYYINSWFTLPQKITEITYTSDNDSIVKRTTYSHIQTGYDLEDSMFNFKIPDNAIKVDL
jgi:outer membrane lipoprotein-sorting protein